MQLGTQAGAGWGISTQFLCMCLALWLPLAHAHEVTVSPLTPLTPTTAATPPPHRGDDTATPPSTRYRLEDLVRRALPQQARLKAADASLRSAQAQVDMAKAQLRPNLSASASRLKNRLDSTAPNLQGQVNTTQDQYFSSNQTLTLRQPLYRPALTAGVRSAEAQATATAQQIEQEINGIAAYMGAVYFELLLAQRQQAWASVQMAARRTQLDAAERSLAAGNGTVTDVDETRARLDLALADQADATVYLRMSEQQLAILVGGESVPPLESPQPAPLADLLTPTEQQAQHWIDAAHAHNPEIQQLLARQQAALEEIARAQAGHQPTVDLLLQRSRSGNENVTRINSSYDNTSIGLQLNIPLYAGGYTSAQVRQVVAEHEKASASIDIAKAQLSNQVFKEYRAMAENMARHAALQQALVSARTALRSTQMAQEAGLKTWADVALAQLQVATTELDSTKTHHQALLAKLRLSLLAAPDEKSVHAAVEQLAQWLFSQLVTKQGPDTH